MESVRVVMCNSSVHVARQILEELLQVGATFVPLLMTFECIVYSPVGSFVSIIAAAKFCITQEVAVLVGLVGPRGQS